MERQLLYELIGYVASVVVAVSLMMSSILRLRIINLIGSTIFSLYGFLIGAIPVGVLNAFIALINIYYLAQILRTREYFRILRVQPDTAYLHYFLALSGDDIRRFYPSFHYLPGDRTVVLFVLRDTIPAGVIIMESLGAGRARIVLDYVLPRFRDLKVARFLFHERRDFFQELGVTTVLADAPTPELARYYRRMGFRPAAEHTLELAIPAG